MTDPSSFQLDFIGIGAQKAGTTALDAALRTRSRINLPRGVKELHYFDRYHMRGMSWLQAQFATAPETDATGEITPAYFHDVTCLERIATEFPHAKLVLVLRAPVARAVSNFYMFQKTNGIHTLTQALEADPRLIQRSEYARQLTDLFALFPRAQVHVVIMERLLANPAAELNQLLEFLGVDEPFAADYALPHLNERAVYRSGAAGWVINRAKRAVRDLDMGRFITVLGRSKMLRRLLYSAPAEITAEDRTLLEDRLAGEVDRTERALGMTIGEWR